MQKRRGKYSDQIPHRREFLSQAEMVDAKGQKTSMRDSSVLTRDEKKSSADIPTPILVLLLLLSKIQKSRIEVTHGGQEDYLEIELKT